MMQNVKSNSQKYAGRKSKTGVKYLHKGVNSSGNVRWSVYRKINGKAMKRTFRTRREGIIELKELGWL